MSCIVSFIPLMAFALSMVAIILCAIWSGEGTMSAGEMVLAAFMFIFVLFTVIIVYAIMIWYMIKACKNPNLSTGMKVLWCAVLYCFNMFIFPVFWFIYVKQEYDSY